jgi:hypothetical protein
MIFLMRIVCVLVVILHCIAPHLLKHPLLFFGRILIEEILCRLVWSDSILRLLLLLHSLL